MKNALTAFCTFNSMNMVIIFSNNDLFSYSILDCQIALVSYIYEEDDPSDVKALPASEVGIHTDIIKCQNRVLKLLIFDECIWCNSSPKHCTQNNYSVNPNQCFTRLKSLNFPIKRTRFLSTENVCIIINDWILVWEKHWIYFHS